ncbi:unnamed protein product [Chrysoparadoxa australica]
MARALLAEGCQRVCAKDVQGAIECYSKALEDLRGTSDDTALESGTCKEDVAAAFLASLRMGQLLWRQGDFGAGASHLEGAWIIGMSVAAARPEAVELRQVIRCIGCEVLQMIQDDLERGGALVQQVIREGLQVLDQHQDQDKQLANRGRQQSPGGNKCSTCGARQGSEGAIEGSLVMGQVEGDGLWYCFECIAAFDGTAKPGE